MSYFKTLYDISNGRMENMKIAKAQVIDEVKTLLLLRKVVERVDDIIVLQDKEGKYIYYNEAPVYALKSEDVVGKTPYDFFAKNKAKEMIDRVKKVFESGKSQNFETLVEWKGEKLWYNDTITPLRDDEGNIEAVVTISRNITKLKKAQDKLQQNIRELETWQRLTVDRELKMVELKKEINRLKKELEKYKSV